MNRVEQALRRLALDDDRAVRAVLMELGRPADTLGAREEALVRLGSLLSIGAATVSIRCAVERAYGAGASEREMLGVLLAIGPAIGPAHVVAVAPRLAMALGYDVDSVDD